MKEGGEEGWEDLDAQLGMTAVLGREAEARHVANRLPLEQRGLLYV